MACTGIEFCKLAIVETKARAASLIDELERRLPDFDAPVTINVNGCPNSCARIQVADIGLKGQLVTDDSGNQVEGFQIHLGGTLSGGDAAGSGFGRKVRGLKVTAEELPGLRGARPSPVPGIAAGRRVVRGVDAASRRRSFHDQPVRPRGTVLLPLLRRGGPGAAGAGGR